jgi:hypothetical protein
MNAATHIRPSNKEIQRKQINNWIIGPQSQMPQGKEIWRGEGGVNLRN